MTINAAEFRWRDEGGGRAAAVRCIEFLARIGVEVAELTDEEPQLLEGLAIIEGRILVDRNVAVWPGDLLHEAGHIAVVERTERATLSSIEADGGPEMAAIAWSYAAALECGVSVDQLFHNGGYRGDSETLRTAFADGSYIGAPLLGYFGLCDPSGHEGAHPFPSMIRWLR